MAEKTQTAQIVESGELLKRMEWIDEQRRKSARRISELEQKLERQEGEVSRRDERIEDLERQLAEVSLKLARLPEIDDRISTIREELFDQLEQYDKRRIQAEKESDRLRRVEHESLSREIAETRKELPAIGRLQRDMELRIAEESRLAKLIAMLQTDIDPLRNQITEWERSLAFLEEKEKQNSRNVADIQTQLLEISKRWEPINARIDVLANTLSKSESTRQDVIEAQLEQREIIKKWSEQIQIGEHERNKQLEKWRYALDEHKDIMDKYAREWVNYTEQYKQAVEAVQRLAEWQKQAEQKQQEVSEMLRIELNRIQSRWDGFLLQDEQKWKSADLDIQQRWEAAQRSDRQVEERIHELEEQILAIEDDKDMLRRIQEAQADAIRILPRIWLEEIEKAKAQDPNRRRQPTVVPVREE
jgi:chromosome segregation ATPase